MRGTLALGVAVVFVVGACGCGPKPREEAQGAADYTAAAQRADSALAVRAAQTDARTVVGPSVNVGIWRVEELVCDVPAGPVAPGPDRDLVLRARGSEARLGAAREVLSGAYSEGPVGGGVGNGANPVRYRAVGTELVPEIMNLDMEHMLLARRVDKGEYSDKEEAERQRDQVGGEADRLREKITVVEEMDAAGGTADSGSATAFTPIPQSTSWEWAGPVMAAAERLEWSAAPGPGDGRGALHETVGVDEIRRRIDILLAAAGAAGGGARLSARAE